MVARRRKTPAITARGRRGGARDPATVSLPHRHFPKLARSRARGADFSPRKPTASPLHQRERRLGLARNSRRDPRGGGGMSMMSEQATRSGWSREQSHGGSL